MSTIRRALPAFALALASACAPNTSTVGQRITCETDPDSGVILRCQPGEGTGGANECQDIDEDGDGQPGDDDGAGGSDDGGGSTSTPGDGTLSFTGGSGSDDDSTSSDDDSTSDDHVCDSDGDGMDDGDDDDDDNDGIDDDDDCDEQEGEDGDAADLPYDIKMQGNRAYTPIVDAFAEKGGQPAAILSVEMDGGGAGWRLAELQSGATFTITGADCTHVGNRDVGRDRVIVTWQSSDGHTESDHLDLRYCE
jgi:hypothetical protein